MPEYQAFLNFANINTAKFTFKYDNFLTYHPNLKNLSERLHIELSKSKTCLVVIIMVLILGGTAPWESLDFLEFDWLADTRERNQSSQIRAEKRRLFPSGQRAYLKGSI
jgi:hypothetical protein